MGQNKSLVLTCINNFAMVFGVIRRTWGIAEIVLNSLVYLDNLGLPVQSSLFTLDSGHDAPGVSDCAKLKVPDTLPCACCQLAVFDGDGHAGTDQSGLDVGRHIVCALGTGCLLANMS